MPGWQPRYAAVHLVPGAGFNAMPAPDGDLMPTAGGDLVSTPDGDLMSTGDFNAVPAAHGDLRPAGDRFPHPIPVRAVAALQDADRANSHPAAERRNADLYIPAPDGYADAYLPTKTGSVMLFLVRSSGPACVGIGWVTRDYA